MSLNYDLRSVDRESEYWTSGERLDAITEALIFVTMVVEVSDDGVITAALAPEFYSRVHVWEAYRGIMVGTDKGPRPIEWRDVVGHIGLRTNVFPAMTRRAFVSKLVKILRAPRWSDKKPDTRTPAEIRSEIYVAFDAADEIVRLEMALSG